jgi:adenylate cyclase
MGREIERKFLVKGNAWRDGTAGIPFRQGYLSNSKRLSVRVRVKADQGFLTIKVEMTGITRPEFEYPIPVADANQLLDDLCEGGIIEKKRYVVQYAGMKWEIDEFLKENQGLFLAEVELESEDQRIDLPAWAGDEVTTDKRYLNAYLSQHPYNQWGHAPDGIQEARP